MKNLDLPVLIVYYTAFENACSIGYRHLLDQDLDQDQSIYKKFGKITVVKFFLKRFIFLLKIRKFRLQKTPQGLWKALQTFHHYIFSFFWNLFDLPASGSGFPIWIHWPNWIRIQSGSWSETLEEGMVVTEFCIQTNKKSRRIPIPKIVKNAEKYRIPRKAKMSVSVDSLFQSRLLTNMYTDSIFFGFVVNDRSFFVQKVFFQDRKTQRWT